MIKRFFKIEKANKKPTKTNTYNRCVQCNKKIRAATEVGGFPVCIQPGCPNYGIVQVGRGRIADFIKSTKTKTK